MKIIKTAVIPIAAVIGFLFGSALYSSAEVSPAPVVASAPKLSTEMALAVAHLDAPRTLVAIADEPADAGPPNDGSAGDGGEGSGSGSASVPDPIDDTGGWLSDAIAAFRAGQYLSVVLLVIFAGVRLAQAKIAWLAVGRRAVLTAAALTTL